MTINFYLDSKLLRNGEKSVVCYVRGVKNCKTILINTQIKIKPEQWNSNSQNVRKGHPDYAQLNAYFDKFANEIKSAYIEYSNLDKPFETNIFKDYLKDKLFNKSEKPKFNFFDVMDNFIASKKSEFSKGHITNLISLKKTILEFQTYLGYAITFDKIDFKFNDKFTDFCIQQKKYKNNTLMKKKKQLTSFLNWTIQRNYHNNTEYKQFKVKYNSVDIITLNDAELMKIFNLELEKDSLQFHIRNIFCLCCFTGARYSDIMNLKYEDISNNTWHLRTQKTKEIIEIPLIDKALEIINSYKISNSPLPKIDNMKYNIELKNIAKLAEIDMPVTIVEYVGAERIEVIKPKYEFVSSHMGRRTFVTLSLEKGLRAEIVMKITGHKDYKSFKRYIEITSKVKHQEMMKAWN